ncbi:MAG: glycosyltransferase [Sulfurimonas sp.]
MIKTAACVVLYNPSVEVLENIATYADKVDHFIVIDNSDRKQPKIIETLKSIYSNLIYIDNHGNLGIATALNIACDTAIIQSSDWILTMDQDSKFINFQDYLDCLHLLSDKSDIALLAPNTGRFSAEAIQKNISDCTHEEHFIVITSGNFLNLNLFNIIGRFDDNLFIDYKTEHSPQRAYYIARNYLYLARKYGKLLPQKFSLLKIMNIIFIHDITKILLYEDQKCKKIAAKFLGAYHFMIGKYGKHPL